MNKSVRPTVCDVEADAGDEDEWMNRWMKPFVPEEEEMGSGEGGGEEREGDEEETAEDSEGGNGGSKETEGNQSTNEAVTGGS